VIQKWFGHAGGLSWGQAHAWQAAPRHLIDTGTHA
jgi:hypothetical protein